MELLPLLVCLATLTWPGSADRRRDEVHSRQKRVVWITNDGRLALPPGTSLVISPSLSMPFIRHPPEGFFSNITVSLPFTIDFDKLGLTDNENPYGDISALFSRSMGRAAGGLLADFVAHYMDKRRGKRSVAFSDREVPPHVERKMMDFFHGGERAILYGALEDLLSNFGIAGKPCLLRAICEVHAHPLNNFGLLGEVMKLFLTASKSPYSELLQEYVDAEKAGAGDSRGPGECWPYYKECPKSLFLSRKNKYSQEAELEHQLQDNTVEHESPKFSRLTLDVNRINGQPM